MQDIKYKSRVNLEPLENYIIFETFVSKARKLCKSEPKRFQASKELSQSASKQLKTEILPEVLDFQRSSILRKPISNMDRYLDSQVNSPFKFKLPLRLEKTIHIQSEKKRVPACLTSRKIKSNIEGQLYKSIEEKVLQKNYKTPIPDQESKFLITKYFLSKPLVTIKSKQNRYRTPMQTEFLQPL